MALGSFLILFAAQDVDATVAFDPKSSFCLDDLTTADDNIFVPGNPNECDGDPTAGAVTDVAAQFCLGKTSPAATLCGSGNPKAANFGGNVGFTPAAIISQIDPATPIGAVVATLTSIANIGTINNPCNTTVIVEFTMLNASVNINTTIDPKPPGQSNSLEPLALDADNNGIADGVEKYPSYLNLAFGNIQPVIRSIGITKVPGVTDWIVLNFVVFPPGTQLPELPSFDAAFGYPAVVVLQNSEAPPSQSAISDFCSPLNVTTFTFGYSRDNPCTPPAPVPLGLCPARPGVDPSAAPVNDPDGCDSDLDESGCIIRKNPPAGSYATITYAASQRDADGDGHENSLDTCPFDAEPAWNPRDADATYDADGDGLTTACDPLPGNPSPASSQSCPSGTTGPDQDQDCFSNRQDNCPLVGNDQTDEDKDGLGDTAYSGPGCDPDPNTATGERLVGLGCSVLTIPGSPIGETVPFAFVAENPSLPAGCTPAPPGTTDSDNDGVLDTADRCPNTPAGATVDAVGCTPAQAVLDDDNDGVLNASDKCPGTAAGASVNTDGCSAAQLATGNTGNTDSGTGGPDTGVGALAPAVSSIPAWAAIASGLGGAGLLGSLGAFVSRILRRRRP
jgi:hypothetical protein